MKIGFVEDAYGGGTPKCGLHVEVVESGDGTGLIWIHGTPSVYLNRNGADLLIRHLINAIKESELLKPA